MTEQQQARKATVTTPSDWEIHIEREFDAPRDLVFATFTDPALIPEWWDPTTVVDEMVVRPGGSSRFVILGEDGTEETAFRGTYREIAPPERLVQTFEWEGLPGHVHVETARGSARFSSSTASRTATVSSAPGGDGHEPDLCPDGRAAREARGALIPFALPGRHG